MSIIRDIIERVDDIKPNAFTAKTKLAWIGELDGKVAADVMLMGIEDIRQVEYTYPNGMESEPLVGYPHTGIYDEYLCAKIDYANGEYSKYQNSMEMFNAHYDNFINWFIRTYAPAQGHCGCHAVQYYISAYALAVKHGFSGTMEEWLESLKGDKGDMGDVTPEALEAVEKAEEFARIAEEAANSIVKGFDSGELPEGTSEYFFSPEEADFVIVTIVGGNDISQAVACTATIDCLGIPSDLNAYWKLPDGLGDCLYIFEHDGTIRVSLRDEDVAYGTHISRVRGYRYGNSGGVSDEPIIVTLSEDGTMASHEPRDIELQLQDGKNVYLYTGYTYIPLASATPFAMIFALVGDSSIVTVYYIDQDSSVSVRNLNLSGGGGGGSVGPFVVTLSDDGKAADQTATDIQQAVLLGRTVFLNAGEQSMIPLSYVDGNYASFKYATDEDQSSVEYIIDGEGDVERYDVQYMRAWTEADKTAFISEVIAALPVYNGEVL